MNSTHAEIRIAYLLKRYPRLSETFILHEILELERQGVALHLFSLLDPSEAITHVDVARVRATPRYFPSGRAAWTAYGRAHLALFRRDPHRYVGVVAHVLQQWHHPAALKHFLRAGWLARELQRLGITHVHAHFAHGPAAVAYFVHLLTGLPYSVTAHAKDIYTSPPQLLGRKLRAARFVVTCTAYNAAYLAGVMGSHTAHRIHRIYHGVDLARFRPVPEHQADGKSAQEPVILAVGRLVEKKGFPYLITAMGLLAARGVQARLQIAGGGELEESLRRQIAEAGLERRITLLGPLPQERVIELYRSATIVALPSIVMENGDRDGIPNVLVEAMRLEVPVVSTAVSGIPELVIDGETGVLVPPRDAAALAAALARLLDDPGLRRRLAAAAAQHVGREFDLATNTTRLRMLLQAPAPVWEESA